MEGRWQGMEEEKGREKGEDREGKEGVVTYSKPRGDRLVYNYDGQVRCLCQLNVLLML